MSSPDAPPRLIDARGHRCPVPTLKLRRAVADAAPGARLRLICDDPLARIDVPHYAAQAGLEVSEISEENGVLGFVLIKPACSGGRGAP